MTTVPIPGGLLTLWTQLGSGSDTAGSDCSAVTAINAIRWASHGLVGPDSEHAVGDWVRQVRRWCNRPTGGLLFRGDTVEVYHHPDLQRMFSHAGLSPLVATYEYRVSWDTVKARLYADRLIHLPIHYGVLRRSSAPMGSATFSGGHSLALLGARNVRGKVWTNDGDPLFDGRRAGVPKGWTPARLPDFRAAAGQWGAIAPGIGKATIISIKRST